MTKIQIKTVVNATLLNLGIITVDYGKSISELVGNRFPNSHVSCRTFVAAFNPEDRGAKRLEVAILQFDTDLQREALTAAITSIDEANPWRFGGVSALLTLGSDDERKEDFNLIAFASDSILTREPYGCPVLNPSKRALDVQPRCRKEAVLIVRDAPTS